jgi:GTP-binding protein
MPGAPESNMQAQFVITAARPSQFPPEEGPEFAFLGRSNVGKSSLLNRLLGSRKLARTSSTPGCTQAINFFRVEPGMYFVDFPGYGYARVPLSERRRWKGLIETYLRQRKALRLCFLLVDARHGWMETDLELKRWLEFHQRPFMVIATKIDKWRNQRERRLGLAALREHIAPGGLVPFSAVTGQGVKEIWLAIRST